MKKYDIAVLDFETMNEHMNSPCEVAVSLIKDLSIVKFIHLILILLIIDIT